MEVYGMDGFAEGMRQSQRSADHRWTPLESAQVDLAIAEVARKGEPFTTDEVWAHLGAAFPVSKGMAARLNAAVRRGIITNTGEIRTSSRTGDHDHGQRLTVWVRSERRGDPPPQVSPLRSPGRYEAPQGDPTCPVHGSTCRKVWHREDAAPGRPGSPQEGVPDHLVRYERDGKSDVYVNLRKAEASSRDAARAATAEEERQRKIATPRVDPASHRVTFGGPMPCGKCGGTGGNLLDACIYCGGKGLR